MSVKSLSTVEKKSAHGKNLDYFKGEKEHWVYQ